MGLGRPSNPKMAPDIFTLAKRNNISFNSVRSEEKRAEGGKGRVTLRTVNAHNSLGMNILANKRKKERRLKN